VFFNDSTKIVLDPGGHHFDYYERRASDKKDVGKSHTLSDYSKELQKKVTLLQHFRSYLEGSEKPEKKEEGGEEEEKKQASEDPAPSREIENIVYVCEEMDENQTCHYVQAFQ